MKRAYTADIHILLTSTTLALSLAAAGCSGEDGGTSGSGGGASASSSAGNGGSDGSGGASSSASGGSGGSGGSSTSSTGSGNPGDPSLSFFVSSTGSTTANLGGLTGADQRCQDLAEAVGAGMRTWRAYLSAETSPDDGPTHAKDRIGQGPWYNAKLEMVATDLEDLHARTGSATVFLNEKGEPINGQWAGSPTPNQHDILTGSERDGTVKVGFTCGDWTSEDPAKKAWVGHSDGLGPNMNDGEPYKWWNSVHENGSCADTAPKGGSGKVYCFAAD
jgi:hypothetical protein